MNGYSQQDLIDFLDFLANKGLMKKPTATSRKAAVNTLLSVLDEEERSDIRSLDLDQLMDRFANLRGQKFKPVSLKVYKSRLSSVLNDFQRYKSDPLGFKPSVGSKPNRTTPKNNAEEAPQNPTSKLKKMDTPTQHKVDEITFPIPIRSGIIVRVVGIPSDLTPEEAEKIGNVVLALSGSQEER